MAEQEAVSQEGAAPSAPSGAAVKGSGLELVNLTKVFHGGVVAVEDVNLHIDHGEYVVLLGPSGCGKTTTLRMIGGHETPTSGDILLDGESLIGLSPDKRPTTTVFQHFALFPHRSVLENVEFGLKMTGVPKEERRLKAMEALEMVGLQALADRKPRALSGGQQQRVALGRALVREPSAFLLDEPLSNLDAKLRAETRAELKRLHGRLGATMLYVTHDQEEAMTLGDRLGVLRDGALQQVGGALDVYRRPANRFVAEFIGSPAMNLLDARVVRDPSGARAEGSGFEAPLPPALARAALPAQGILGVRPQDAVLAPEGEGEAQARVEVVEPLGSTVLVHVVLEPRSEAKPRRVAVLAPADLRPEAGVRIGVRFPAAHLHLFDRETGARLG